MPPLWALLSSPSEHGSDAGSASESPKSSKAVSARRTREVEVTSHYHKTNHRLETTPDVPIEVVNGTTKRHRSHSVDFAIKTPKRKPTHPHAMPHRQNNDKGTLGNSRPTRGTHEMAGEAPRLGHPSPSSKADFDNFDNRSIDGRPDSITQSKSKDSGVVEGQPSAPPYEVNSSAESLGIKAKPTYNPRINASQKEYDASKLAKQNPTPSWFQNPYLTSTPSDNPRFKSSGMYYSSRSEYEAVNRLDKPESDPKTRARCEGSVATPMTGEGYSTDENNVYKNKEIKHNDSVSEKKDTDTDPADLEGMRQHKNIRAKARVEKNDDDGEDNLTTRCSRKLGRAIEELHHAARMRAEAARQKLERQSSD